MNIHLLSYNIINAAYEVHNTLGIGFGERVSQMSLFHELKLRNYQVVLEKSIDVYYKKQNVGHYKIDLCVENCFLVETKCVETIINTHIKQVKNYLSATGFSDALIINFKHKSVKIKHIYSKDEIHV